MLAAMDLSSHVPYSDVLSAPAGEMSPPTENQKEMDSPQLQGSGETLSRANDRSGRPHPTVDVAEILRRWTHALQRIHKQSLQLVYCILLHISSNINLCFMLLLYFDCPS